MKLILYFRTTFRALLVTLLVIAAEIRDDDMEARERYRVRAAIGRGYRRALRRNGIWSWHAPVST